MSEAPISTTVVALQGRPIASTPPAANQVLQFTGGQWAPTTLTAGTGTVTSVAAGTGITLTPNPVTTVGSVALTVPVAIANGGTNATTASAALANLGGISGNQTITLSGDVAGSGATAIATTLANSGVIAGTYNNITINAKGLATAGSNVAYLTTAITSLTAGNGITLTPAAITATGSIALTSPVTVSNGGTGASTAPAALTSLGALPTAGGTMTGPLVMNARLNSSGAFTIGGDNYPTLGIHEALTVTGSNPGVHGGAWFFNVADTMAVGAGTWWVPFVITHNFDASVGTGNREPLLVTMQTANGTAGQSYVSAQFTTELTSGSGNAFGINPYVQIDATAGASVVAAGAEIDTDVRVNVLGKACLQLADVATSTGVGPLGYDCALLTERQSGAAGYAVGLQFGRYGGGAAIAGSNGVKQTGTILQVVPGTALAGQPDFAYGIDFRSTTITNAAFASPGFAVDGSGNIALSNATSNWVTFANGLGPPTFTTRSVGTKLVLSPTLSGTATDWAIGLASGQMWFTGNAYQWYNLQQALAMTLDGSGNLIAISTMRAGSPTAPTGGYAIGDINGQRLLLNGTPLGTVATQNANAVAITGGTVNGTSVGATTTSTGAFTALSASSTVSGAGFTTLLAPYAPLASPTFTGTPNLPTGTVGVTQTAGNNTTALATTAFVTTAVGSYLPLAGGTVTGTITLTGVAAQIALNNATSNWVQWSANGAALPTFTTRSAGTKLVLFPNIGAATLDYAIGVTGGTLWYSGGNHQFFGTTTTQTMYLDASGNLTLAGNLKVNSNANPTLAAGVAGTYTGLYAPDGTGTSSGIFLSTVAGGGNAYYRDTAHTFQDPAGAATFGALAATGCSFVGTNTNNNAAAGQIGEYLISDIAGAGTALTSGTVVNLTTLSLTAGDWDVMGTTFFYTGGAAAAMTETYACLSTTSLDNTQSDMVHPWSRHVLAYPTGNGRATETPGPMRVSIAATTTVYLVCYATFSGASATVNVIGVLRARRMR